MALLLCVQLLLMLVALVVAEETVRYDGYHLLRTVPQTNENVKKLASLENKVDFWIEPTSPGRPVDIFVSPEKVVSVSQFISTMGLEAEVIMDNAQMFIGKNRMARMVSPNATDFNWKDYHTIETIYDWLSQQAQKFNHIATLTTAGKSTEGRDLLGLRIVHKPNQPIVFIEGGIHAREWITPATATWFIQEALTTTSPLIKSYEWHVFPSVNPDGYAYTQKNRMWRKTRSKVSSQCIGVDANRNWPFKWMKGPDSACTDSYSGPVAASEPETRGLEAYLQNIANRTRVYISLHSYSQILMYPWGYTNSTPPHKERFHDIAGKAVKKLNERYGTRYKYGPIASTLYPAAGNSIDYAFSLNITYPFVFELRDRGRYGFLLPKQQIIPTAVETFDAVNVILAEAQK